MPRVFMLIQLKAKSRNASSLEIHKHNRAKRETTTLIMRMLMHAVRTSVKPRLTEGGSDVVEHGRGDQLPEGTAARLAAGERIGDLLANEAVKDDFSQTLVVVVGASAIAVVVVVGAIADAVAASASAIIFDTTSIIVVGRTTVRSAVVVEKLVVATHVASAGDASTSSGGKSGSVRA